MISMPEVQFIRQLRRNGDSIASIARKVGVSEPTVRKYLKMEDLSPRTPVRRRRPSVIDEWVPLIEQWLAEDRGRGANSVTRPLGYGSVCATSMARRSPCRR